MTSSLIAMAFNLEAMASNLIAMAFQVSHPNSQAKELFDAAKHRRQDADLTGQLNTFHSVSQGFTGLAIVQVGV